MSETHIQWLALGVSEPCCLCWYSAVDIWFHKVPSCPTWPHVYLNMNKTPYQNYMLSPNLCGNWIFLFKLHVKWHKCLLLYLCDLTLIYRWRWKKKSMSADICCLFSYVAVNIASRLLSTFWFTTAIHEHLCIQDYFVFQSPIQKKKSEANLIFSSSMSTL